MAERESPTDASTERDLEHHYWAAEKALRESEARFRAVADSAPAPIWVTSRSGIEFVNHALAEFAGRDAAGLLGEAWTTLVHPDDLEEVRALRDRAWQAGEPYAFEARFLRHDGEWRWLRVSTRPRDHGDGPFLGYVGMAIDVTDARRAEADLREETRILETLNRIGAALGEEREVGRVVDLVTDAGVELSGAAFGAFFYNVVDAKGEHYKLYTVSGVDRGAFDRLPMPRNTALFAPTFSGEAVVRSDDITKDPRYGKSDTHHGMPKEHLPVVSYLAVPVVSRSGEVIGGLFFGHPEPARFTERHEHILVGGAAQSAISIDNARLFEAAEREIGERRRAEEALRELNRTLEKRVEMAVAERERVEEALRQAQKMEAIGQLTGGIAHDFNNLLTVIIGNLELFRRRAAEGLEPRVAGMLDNALVGAERASALTQRLLAFSRRQPLAPRPLDANRLISGMSELLQRTLGETVRIETRLADDLWEIEADPHQLENAILNLAVNARDAMPGGGTLTIATTNEAVGSDADGRATGLSADDHVVLSVSDTGAGMDEDTMARAFEPFFTTKDVGKGTGLGLSMVYGFVRQSGGHVEIDSIVGEGTTVRIHLPRRAGPPAATESSAGHPRTADGGDETILICEDDPGVRAYSADVLREAGYRVVEAEDAASALAVIERGEKLNLLFTDIVLPGGLTGTELARRARKLRPGLRVLCTTGYAPDAVSDSGWLGESTALIAKPFSAADLAARIREVLDGPVPGEETEAHT
jgi:PAS domain S-box-containing protein